MQQMYQMHQAQQLQQFQASQAEAWSGLKLMVFVLGANILFLLLLLLKIITYDYIIINDSSSYYVSSTTHVSSFFTFLMYKCQRLARIGQRVLSTLFQRDSSDLHVPLESNIRRGLRGGRLFPPRGI